MQEAPMKHTYAINISMLMFIVVFTTGCMSQSSDSSNAGSSLKGVAWFLSEVDKVDAREKASARAIGLCLDETFRIYNYQKGFLGDESWTVVTKGGKVYDCETGMFSNDVTASLGKAVHGGKSYKRNELYEKITAAELRKKFPEINPSDIEIYDEKTDYGLFSDKLTWVAVTQAGVFDCSSGKELKNIKTRLRFDDFYYGP